MKKNVFMNFVNPNAVDGEKPYRVHCTFVLRGNAPCVIDVYKCAIVKQIQTQNVDNRIVHCANNDIFVFQNENDENRLFDTKLFKKMCKNCQYKQR